MDLKQTSKLWENIQNYIIDDVDSSLKFSQRLMRENLGWSYEYTLRVIEEYKRFMFLGCVSDKPVTPSDEIDQVWHLHMIYTRQYWDEFCDGVLGKKFHHGPTKGGKSESVKYMDLYKDTISSYKKFFQQEPPPDIWKDPTERFRKFDFKRVCMDDHWVIPTGDVRMLFKLLVRSIKKRICQQLK